MDIKSTVNPVKALLAILFGVVTIFFYTETVYLGILLLSTYLVIDGLLEITHSLFEAKKSRSLIAGCVSLVTGILLFLNSQSILAIFVYVVAAKFLLESSTHIIHIFKDKRSKLEIDDWVDVGKNILLFGLSIWLIFTPISSLSTLFLIIGIYALVSGAVSLFRSRSDILRSVRSIKIGGLWRRSRPYIASGAGYGVGFLLGSAALYLLFSIEENDLLQNYETSQRGTLAFIVLMIALILHGTISGAVGSLLLSTWNDDIEDRKKYILRSSIGLSLASVVVVMPLVITIFLTSFHSDGETPLVQSIFIFTIFSAIYGLISSSVLLFDKFNKEAVFSSISKITVGYSIGGALLGASIWFYYFYEQLNHQDDFGPIWIILGIFLFGFSSGISILLASNFLHQIDISKLEIDKRGTALTESISSFFSSEWFDSHTVKRFIGLTILIIILIGVTFSFILNRPDLGSEISANTVGTSWQITDDDLQLPAAITTVTENINVDCEDDRVLVKVNDEEFEYEVSCDQNIKPLIINKGDEEYHLFWVSDQVEKVLGKIDEIDVLYEVIVKDGDLSSPYIITQVEEITELDGNLLENNSLALFWEESDGKKYTAFNREYECEVSTQSELVIQVIKDSQKFHEDIQYPYCLNRYDQLIYTPNPDEAFSSAEPRENGAFDYFKDVISEANYEVMISNMWYEEDIDRDSPGNYISEGVAELYKKIQEDPEAYPRGLHIKILLGNPPEFLLLDTEGQIWSALEDLRAAGVDKLEDKELGWKVEVANFGGSLPHSHTKQVIIDGETVIAAGINVQYKHFPLDHFSEQGGDRVDNAIQITGPIAQLSMASFDDIWDGADKKHCTDFYPTPEDSWRLTCFDEKAEVEHVPEVLRYYIPEDHDNSNYFSLYRSLEYKESDDVLGNAIANANESIDVIQVNFALDMICDLNVLFDVCTVENSPQYMRSLIEALDNGVKVRVLTKQDPIDGIENKVAIEQLDIYVEEKGIEDQLEIRYFDGEFHSKVVHIDNELVVIGSQNFHYSAWGDGGLTEFNAATDNPVVNEEILKFFNYHWERAEQTE